MLKLLQRVIAASRTDNYDTHLSCMHILALHACVPQYADVVSHTKVKQGPRLATCLVDDEVVEGEMMGQDQILLQQTEATPGAHVQVRGLR